MEQMCANYLIVATATLPADTDSKALTASLIQFLRVVHDGSSIGVYAVRDGDADADGRLLTVTAGYADTVDDEE